MYSLGGSTIKAPYKMTETNVTQCAVQRVLSGNIGRDYFGSNKKVWKLYYKNTSKTHYDTINTIYQTYLSTGSTQAFISTETNYLVSSTKVHIDLADRDFDSSGDSYISGFTLILTEA
jgi:hypothetical protein